jgi:hypothetical protein
MTARPDLERPAAGGLEPHPHAATVATGGFFLASRNTACKQ